MKKLLISLFLFSFLVVGSQAYAVSDINNPIIFGISGPQTLNINQTGTWKVEASNANGGDLSYSVNWGDEKYHILPMSSLAPSINNTQQSATFTHSYSQSGLYKPAFTVTSENTINCITIPCPSNSGSTKTSLTVKVLRDDGCLPSYKYNPVTGKLCSDIILPSITEPSSLSHSIIPIKRILKNGTKGDDVKKLQLFLNLVADGVFGSETKKKVTEWQADNGLKADGLFGSESIKKAGLND
jgi:hypothetical protein